MAGISSLLVSYNYLGMSCASQTVLCCTPLIVHTPNIIGKVVGKARCSASAFYGMDVCPETGMVLASGTGGSLDVASMGTLVGGRRR